MGVIIVVSIAINAYIGFGPSPSSDLKTNFHSNTKANPFAMRIYFHLAIIMARKLVVIPSQIGIDEPLLHNHTLDKYGAQGMTMPAMAPIHTNDNDGLIKIGIDS